MQKSQIITQAEVEKSIDYVEYHKFGNKTMVCFIRLKTGFELITSAYCLDPEGFDEEIGKQESYNKAIEELTELHVGMKYLQDFYQSK